MLDLIFCDELIVEIIILGKSDHAYIAFSFNVQEDKRKKQVYLYEKADHQLKRNCLDRDWKVFLPCDAHRRQMEEI